MDKTVITYEYLTNLKMDTRTEIEKLKKEEDNKLNFMKMDYLKKVENSIDLILSIIVYDL